MLVLLASEDERRLAKPTRQDLVLSIGTFCVTEEGILAQLRPPLSRLPGYYPWPFFPTGMAVLKLLTVDDVANSVCDVVVSRLGLSEEEKDQLARMIGNVDWVTIGSDKPPIYEHESDFCDDVDRLIRWGVGLADRCPNRVVARDLINLPMMEGPELLDRYVRPFLS